MILKAPDKFQQWVEGSANYLNSPDCIFNDHLNATYRQFYYDGKQTVIYRLAVLLFTFGYSKKEAYKIGEDLYLFYESVSHAEFQKMNVNTYLNALPDHIQKKHENLNRWFEANTKTIYHKFTGWFETIVPSYPFIRGYQLKTL